MVQHVKFIRFWKIKKLLLTVLNNSLQNVEGLQDSFRRNTHPKPIKSLQSKPCDKQPSNIFSYLSNFQRGQTSKILYAQKKSKSHQGHFKSTSIIPRELIKKIKDSKGIFLNKAI